MTILEMRKYLDGADSVSLYVDSPREVCTADIDNNGGAIGSDWQPMRDAESTLIALESLIAHGYALIDPGAARTGCRF